MCIRHKVQKTGCSSGRKGLAHNSVSVYAKVSPLVTISMALDIHEVRRQPWITANVCSILSVNNGLLT